MRPRYTRLHSATLSWELPHLGEHFSLQGFTIIRKDSSSDEWECIASVDRHARQFDIPSAQIPSTGRVAVQADYLGESIPSEEHTFSEGNS